MPELGERVRDSLELLQGKDRLSTDAIDGLDKYVRSRYINNGSVMRWLNQLADVNVEGVEGGQTIVYDATNQKWKAGNMSSDTLWQPDGTGFIKPKDNNKVKAEHIDGIVTDVDWDDIGGNQSDINISGFTNDAGYLTSETDTLQSVTDRGSTTTHGVHVGGESTFDDNVIFDGNVGIGTNNPTETLQVAGTGLFEDDVEVEGDIIADDNIIFTRSGSGASAATIRWEGQSAYIGGFGSYLAVSNISLGSSNIRGNANGGAQMFGVSSRTLPRYSFRGETGTGLGTSAEDTLALYTDGNVRLEIAPTGEVDVKNDLEISDLNKGVILKSPNGNRWRVQVSNDGNLTTEEL